jgi:hypothetical protein
VLSSRRTSRYIAQIAAYAQHAAVPISEYAAQYGPNSVQVSQTLVTYRASVPSAYTDEDVQRWVNEMAAGLPGNSSIFIISPQGVPGPPEVGPDGGYHFRANIPYMILGVYGTGLTLPDTADVYAQGVSHEIAEMVVDPNANLVNPEVCDPCDTNCNMLNRCYFDGADKYLGSNQAMPPGGFPYSYFICAIVQPAGAGGMCQGSLGTCQYAPPLHAGEQVLWASNTYLRPVVQCAMGEDGNLLLFDEFANVLFQSGTAGHPGSRLVIKDDGNVVILDRGNNVIWQTHTALAPPTIKKFFVNPQQITKPNPTTISWEVTQPRDCAVNVRLTQKRFNTEIVLSQRDNLQLTGAITDTPTVASDYYLEAICPDGRAATPQRKSVAVQSPDTGSLYCYKVDAQASGCVTDSVYQPSQSEANAYMDNKWGKGTWMMIDCSRMTTACDEG